MCCEQGVSGRRCRRRFFWEFRRNLLTDGRGVPLSIVVCGANRHDVKRLPELLDAVVIPRPPVTEEAPQNLCADAGYVGKTAKLQMEERGYAPHVRSRGEEIDAKAKDPNYKPRR
jgi:putative transposase